jgi:hypothetical protein
MQSMEDMCKNENANNVLLTLDSTPATETKCHNMRALLNFTKTNRLWCVGATVMLLIIVLLADRVIGRFLDQRTERTAAQSLIQDDESDMSTTFLSITEANSYNDKNKVIEADLDRRSTVEFKAKLLNYDDLPGVRDHYLKFLDSETDLMRAYEMLNNDEVDLFAAKYVLNLEQARAKPDIPSEIEAFGRVDRALADMHVHARTLSIDLNNAVYAEQSFKRLCANNKIESFIVVAAMSQEKLRDMANTDRAEHR